MTTFENHKCWSLKSFTATTKKSSVDPNMPHPQDVVKKIENTSKDSRDKPLQDVTIRNSGTIAVGRPFVIAKQ